MNKCQAILKGYEVGDHVYIKTLASNGLTCKINKIRESCLEVIGEDGKLYRFNSLYIIYICEVS